MKRRVRPREWPLIEAAFAKAVGHGFCLERLPSGFRRGVTVEVMNRNFTKYHLGRGFALHRFSGVDLGPPHDHPGGFTTLILEPYIEEIYAAQLGGWTCERVLRPAGSSHAVGAPTVHRIVALPSGVGWTLVHYGPHVQETRFYRFGQVVESRARRQRVWRVEKWRYPDRTADVPDASPECPAPVGG